MLDVYQNFLSHGTYSYNPPKNSHGESRTADRSDSRTPSRSFVTNADSFIAGYQNREV